MLLGRMRSSCGQMTVELAVTIPVVMAVAAIVINTMVYLDVSARFDRLAAEAVRIEAVAPHYGAYGTEARVGRVRLRLQEQFADEARFVRIEVKVNKGPSPGSIGDTLEPIFLLVPQLETYECTLRYSPFGFGNSFFGINFLEMSHTRSYTIDPFRPAVIA